MSKCSRPRVSHRRYTQRRSFLIACFLLVACGACLSVPAHAQIPDARPAGYVSDFAGVMSAQGKQQLEALAAELDRKTGSQIAIVTINTLQGEPIEDFSVKLATKWGIGRKAQGDTGVLLLLAIQDRKSRMEVGYGIEPIIPDGRAGMILRDMRPQLQAGDYDGALIQAAGQVASFIAQSKGVKLDVALPQQNPPRRGSEDSQGGAVFWIIILAVIVLLVIPRGPRRRGWYGGSSTTGFIVGNIVGSLLSGGGSGSGGGSSSGGFGGFGGGGFGGGGASSSW